ncbi:MAG: hypothetical protein Q8O18_01060, partial [Deltaproteobacteria bacterium]|nr:hypothetical protein [Deltaproteobacteria bacterium]
CQHSSPWPLSHDKGGTEMPNFFTASLSEGGDRLQKKIQRATVGMSAVALLYVPFGMISLEKS